MKRLDVRVLKAPARDDEVLQSFDALGAGEAFELVDDQDPKPLRLRFIAERAGYFDWYVLENGPELFRVQIRKRSVPGQRGVHEYLKDDHARLGELLTHAAEEIGSGDALAAAAAFAELACGLERHMDMEEHVLFPVFEKASGMTVGPTAVMCREHETFRELLAGIEAALGRGDLDEADDKLREMSEVFQAHHLTEENFIYSGTDERLGAEARDELVRQMLLR